jgi:hypothetical protein
MINTDELVKKCLMLKVFAVLHYKSGAIYSWVIGRVVNPK